MKKLGIVIITILLTLAACAPEAALSPKGAPTPKEAVARPTVSRQPWEIEWEKALTEARKEGKVVIYSNAGGDVRAELTRAFRDKFGMDLEWVMGGGSELVTKLLSERRAGLYFTDMRMHGSSNAIAQLKPAGILESLLPTLLLPEVVDPKVWWGSKPHFVDTEGKYVLNSLFYPSQPVLINTEQVKPEEVKSYKNLLEPRWKGKIVINDPTKTGNGANWVAVVAHGIMDVEFLRQLARQEITLTGNERLLIEWVSRGKYPVGIAAHPDTVAEFMKAGAPIKYIIPLEGSHLSGGSGTIFLMKQAPHPNATTVFVNWFLSKEGQTLYSKLKLQQSARADLPVDHLSPDSMRYPSVRYFDTENEEFKLKQNQYLNLAKEIFGPLAK